MTYIPVNKANTNHKSRDDNGREIARYSRYETGVIDGKNRELLAVIADQAGFDGMGFDASIGSGDDSWHVANVFDSNRRYVDTMVIGGAFDSLHAKQVADSQLHRLRGDNCVIVTNPQFDSLSDDKPDTWSLDAINKLLANPSQNKSYLPVVTAQELNAEAARVTFDAVQWDSMDGLVSHGGSDSALFLDLIRADGHKQLLEPLNLVRELELLGAEEHSFDALMDKKVRLTLLKDRLFNAMSRAGDAELSVTNVTETKPFKRQGVTNIAFIFDLSDGQKLSIWFHNPDSTPSQLKADDVMISWKWMLNKRDVTAVLSPKQGDNVQLPVLAARIMRVARKNSKKFKAAQARAAALEQELQDAQALVDAKQGEIDQLDTDIAGLNAAIDAAMAKKAEEPTTPPEMTEKEQKEQRERERVLAMQFEEVTQFYKNNGAEPNREADDIIEKMLAKRLESIRANAEFVKYLAPYDTYNLLNDEPEKAIIEGRINESTTVNGTKVVSNFALVEAKELITSHDALGVANPDFPQELQPRDRSDKKSVDAIKLNAKNLQPEKLGDTEYAGNGAPIIGDDFLVESGNGRAIAIKSAYDNGDAGKYKEWLVNNATDFGLSADDVNGYNQPVLVRVRKTEIDRVEFAIEANLDANPSPLDDAAAQATEPEAAEEPADTAPSKTVAIRDALDVLKNDVFKGQTDKVLMYTLNDAGDVVHRSFIKASSKSAQTRFTNKHLYEAGVKTVMTANIPDNNQAAARQLETLGYTIDYSDPEGFTSDDYTVGDVYEMKRKDVFGNSAVEPDDTIIMEFTEWLFLRRGEDAAKLRLATLSGSNSVNLTVAEMDAIVSRGDARRLTQPEIDAARDFEDTKLISTYVNNKGRVLAEVFLQEGVYDIKSSDGSSLGLADVGQVTEKLKAIKSRNASMKYQSGQDFLRDDGGKTYPPVEYDEEEREYIAYMNNKKVDKWTAYQVSGGDWAVVADNAQSRAFNSWNPKYFDNVDQLLAAYPAFKGIKALIAQAEQDDYESIDSSRFPSMFLERHADKLQTLGITDDDIQYRHDDDSDNLYVEAGIFKDKTLNYTDAVCNVVDAAISLYADVAVSDFNATVYQDSLFDSLTSQSKPTYGVTVQIVKFDATVRAKIDIDGTCEILQGASGEDVVATIKHRYTENTQPYIDAIDKAFQAQSDKKAADAAALQAEIDKKEAENMKDTTEWWNTTADNVSVYLIGKAGGDNYVRIKDQRGQLNALGDPITKYEYSAMVMTQGYEDGEDGSLAEIQAFVKEKTKDKGELRLVKGADVLAMKPQADSTPASDDDDLTDAPASDDNSELSKQLADLESTVNAEDFNPADFDTKGFIELVTATADDAELTARVMAISSVYQQKLVAASMAAMTSLAGGA